MLVPLSDVGDDQGVQNGNCVGGERRRGADHGAEDDGYRGELLTWNYIALLLERLTPIDGLVSPRQ